MFPKYSVICLTYKRPELLEEAIQSVLRQTYSGVEMIVVNDYSNQEFILPHPKIHIFNVSAKFETLGDKRNFAVSKACGEYVLLLDDDDIFLSDYIEILDRTIGEYDWLSSQRTIMYYDSDPSLTLLSSAQLSSTIVFRRVLAENVQYESKNYDELTPFFNDLSFTRSKGLRKSLKPEETGYVYRKFDDGYSMFNLRTKTVQEQNNIVKTVSCNDGRIELRPRWRKDYEELIRSHVKYMPMKPPKQVDVSLGNNFAKKWNKVKKTWENAELFLRAITSRGLVASAANVLGLDNSLGERVSEEIYEKRKTSCFGSKEKNIQPCAWLKHIENKGYFCGGCGCGSKDLARLDSDSPDEYTKLHYPQLECPLKKRGFSNHSVPISIIMPVLNDNEEANLTIKSIYKTSPDNVEVIVIDDASDNPVAIDDKRVKLFRFDERKGAGQARHFGALNATSKHLLFIDSHMRFDPDWFDNAIKRITDSPKTLWCGMCLGLNEKNMDITNPIGKYTGADFVLYKSENNVIFDGVWKPNVKDQDDHDISCVMGACYFIHKDWYFHIRGLESTMMWGSEEPILSLKTWLAGGDVKLMKSVKLGHKFRDVAPYSTNISHIHYNKLAYMFMMLPLDLYETLKDKFHKDGNLNEALKLVEQNKIKLEEEREYYKSIFQRDIFWFCDKFQIEIPDDTK